MMASRYEVVVTIISACDLKNVNWRYGDLKPYAVLWVDPASKFTTKVDVDGGVNPSWDDKQRIPLPYGTCVEDSTLFIDIVHVKICDNEDTKPLIGSARLPLREVVDQAGIGGKYVRSMQLKRPSGRPQGKLEVKVSIKELARCHDTYPPPHGQTVPALPHPYGGYDKPYSAAAPLAGYPYGAPQAYSAPPVYSAPPAYCQQSYGQPSSYGAPPVAVDERKKSKFGLGTGLAVGAATGVLGGLALAKGIDHVEEKIEAKVAERVEEDLAYERYEDGYY